MRLKRRCVYFIMVCFIITTLTSCISIRGIIEGQQKMNSLLPTIRYKANGDSAYGQMAAIYNNHLYYHTEKDGIKGIYRMNLEIEHEELIVEVVGIRKLQITEEGIYYIGRTEENDIEEQSSKGNWNTYQFFFHKGHEKTEVPDELMHEDLYAWDFYVGENVIYFVRILNTVPIGRADLHKYLLEDVETNISWKRCENLIFDVGENKSLSVYEELVFWSRFKLGNDKYEVTSIGTVYDSSIKEPVYILSDRVDTENAQNYVILGEYQNKYICTDNEKIYLLDGTGVYRHKVIGDIDWIKFGFIENEVIYMLAEKGEQERIYQMDLETFEIILLKEVGKGERVVGMVGEEFICVTKKGIIIRDTKTGNIIKEKEWEGSINLEKDTVEIAGEYIFVYTSDQDIILKEMQKIIW